MAPGLVVRNVAMPLTFSVKVPNAVMIRNWPPRPRWARLAVSASSIASPAPVGAWPEVMVSDGRGETHQLLAMVGRAGGRADALVVARVDHGDRLDLDRRRAPP